MDIEVLKEYLNVEAEIWLNNTRKYVGKIISIHNYTVIFQDINNQNISFEAKVIEIIQPLKKVISNDKN